jgi:SET domain-containing protein|tara:strand:+ start:1375 stop:1773 length:399 start_codon:yes stop_codon:yes gene_type:complete
MAYNNQPDWEKKELFNCSKVTLKESNKGGYGVFSNQDISAGEVVEIGVMARLVNVDGNENPHLFTWSDDRTVWAIGSGLLHWYNHDDDPNVKKVGNLTNDTMEIIALKDIKKDVELCNTYRSKPWRKCFQSF